MSSNAAIAWQSFRLRPASLEAGKLPTTACSGGMTPNMSDFVKAHAEQS